MTSEDLIKRWLAGELSDSEKKEFESTEEFAKINKLMRAVNNFKAPEFDVDSEYKKLVQNKKSITLFERLTPMVKLAAILIVTLAVSYFLYDQINTTSTEDGWIAEQTEVYLPDSSFISLNKGSQVKFSNQKWYKERNVELKGEAFFRVKKGSQFNVKTQQGTVRVLGTEFGVKDRPKFYEVTCYSGKVKVLTEQNTVILYPNSVYRIVNNKEENLSVSGSKMEPDWLSGESSFKSVPLRFVINELERQYKVTIETRNVDLDQLFTGGFSHENLEIALESITFPVNLNYQFKGDKILITLEDL
jgi:ferric-dicitrate binding protein FerR (iron transport regulator)